jgi:hypothetical protein
MKRVCIVIVFALFSIALIDTSTSTVDANDNEVKLATQEACLPSFAVKPKEIVLSCADGNAYIGSIRWSRWTSTSALGSGIYMLNSCKPDCATSRITRRFFVTVLANLPKRLGDIFYFSRLSVSRPKNPRIVLMNWKGGPSTRGGYWESSNALLSLMVS